jgi:GxxExxY protein
MLRVETALPEPVEELIHRVIGCCITVHRDLGAGWPENVYRRAMTIELRTHQIPVEAEKTVTVTYRGQLVGRKRLDLVIDQALVVELKAVDRLASVHRSQILGYMRAASIRAGLLVNFNVGAIPDGLKRLVY